MSGGFTAIPLEELPPPDVVEALDYEAILQEMKDWLIGEAPWLADVLALESEPATKILELLAYWSLLHRQRVNDAARGVMLASATGADLDQLAALLGVARLEIDAGDPDAVPPVPPKMESDADLRRRVQLSLEGFSTAGPEGAYLFHALSADGDVRDASAVSPEPGAVLVSLLSRTGDGTAAQDTIDTVDAVLSSDDVRPLGDQVTVQSASIVHYTIEATLTFRPGPDREVVMAAAEAAAQAFADEHHALGRDVPLSGLYAALHQPGVAAVTLTAPSADIQVAATEASYATLIDLYDEGVDG